MLLYASPALRITKTKNTAGVIASKLSVLHRDGLGSVRAVTNAAGLKNERNTYRPFGEQSEAVFGTLRQPTRPYQVFGPDRPLIAEYKNATAARTRQYIWPTGRLNLCPYFCPIRGSVPVRRRSILGRCL